MQTVARRQIDMGVEAALQECLDLNQIERVELIGLLSLNENVDIAVVTSHVAGGRPKDVERSDAVRSDLG